jgi:hypothetical protein
MPFQVRCSIVALENREDVSPPRIFPDIRLSFKEAVTERSSRASPDSETHTIVATSDSEAVNRNE